MSNVFVLDTNKQPLAPVHPGRARLFLRQGQAAVWRRFSFTILLKRVVEQPPVDPLRLKIDPGSRVTGLAITNDQSGTVLFAAELSHRGHDIKKDLDTRWGARRGRRARKTRYRAPRWRNRRRCSGWLPPSLESRIHNVATWVQRLRRLTPLRAISLELVKFDLQKMQNPEIQGAEYQQGTLFGYELREYLLEKWQRKCAYCEKEGVPLQIEHIVPRAKGGSDRVSNLTLVCEPCNTKKGDRDVAVFLKNKPEVVKRIQAQAKAPLKDAAAVNATVRWSRPGKSRGSTWGGCSCGRLAPLISPPGTPALPAWTFAFFAICIAVMGIAMRMEQSMQAPFHPPVEEDRISPRLKRTGLPAVTCVRRRFLWNF